MTIIGATIQNLIWILLVSSCIVQAGQAQKPTYDSVDIQACAAYAETGVKAGRLPPGSASFYECLGKKPLTPTKERR